MLCTCAANGWPGKLAASRFANARARSRGSCSRLSTRPRSGRCDQQVAELAQQIGATVLIDRDMIDVGERDACLAQAIGDRLRGKARPMLDAAEALLLGGRDELPSRTSAAEESP